MKFEEIPKADYAKMDLKDGPWWIFARYSGEGAKGREYLLISGFIRPAFDTEPVTFGEPEEDFGRILSHIGDSYEHHGVPTAFDDEDYLKIDPRVLDGLWDDYVKNAAAALGRKDKVQKQIENYRKDFPSMDRRLARAYARAGIAVPPQIVFLIGRDGRIPPVLKGNQ